MLVDYWFAGQLGRVWLCIRRGLHLRLVNAEAPGLCKIVARGARLHAASLWRVQDFAVRVWWRFGFAVVILMSAFAMTTKATSGGAVSGIALAVFAALASVSAVGIMEAIVVRYRSDRTRLYLRRAGPVAKENPLPNGSPGLPRWYDFWMILLIGIAVFVFLLAGGYSASAGVLCLVGTCCACCSPGGGAVRAAACRAWFSGSAGACWRVRHGGEDPCRGRPIP